MFRMFKEITDLAVKVFAESINHIQLHPLAGFVIETGDGAAIDAGIPADIGDLESLLSHQA